MTERPAVDDGKPANATGDSLAAGRADNVFASGGSAKPKRAPATGGKSDASGTSRPPRATSKPMPDDGKSSPEVATRDSTKPARAIPEKSGEVQDIAKDGTKSATPDPVVAKGDGNDAAKTAGDRPAVAKQPDGTLSVYFLGGVGEFFINGRLFARQPPFDGVSLPAATYRMACRMSGDAAPKEIVVSIRPNQGTVIEYELGHDPVVTTE
jgi:hypothetical protein